MRLGKFTQRAGIEGYDTILRGAVQTAPKYAEKQRTRETHEF